jgi:tetratricopeptide (TPR) repeat protein
MDDHLKQLLLLGREHFQKGDYDKAEYQLKQVVDRADRFADVHDMLGIVAHGKGDFTAAEHHFERAVAINPNYTEAQLNLMVTYNDLGKYEAARSIYTTIRRRDAAGSSGLDPFARGRIANMHADVAQAYLDAGMKLEAIHELERAVQLSGFADLRTKLGVLYRDTGDLVRAREQFVAAKEANPKYLQARILLAVLHLTGGENALAIQELEHVLELDPGNKSAEMYLRIASKRPSELPST